MDEWFKIITKLKNFGIINIYITGGENLINEYFFTITKKILDNGFETGLSTNAMVINKEIIIRLKLLKIETIQVSIDGKSEKTHDFIRNSVGAFKKTIKGIKTLLKHNIEPIFNTVVNKYNINEIEDIIRMGVSLSIKQYKFFPVKSLGRAKHNNLIIEKSKWQKIPFNYFSTKYNVEIDFLKMDGSENCGAGISGFAIDQFADIYPCIFGINNKKQRIGNILDDDILELWNTSKILQNFRKLDNTQPCNRCEL